MVSIEIDRVTADIDGDFVVFLIGMRINALWKVHKWLPVFRAMPRMLRELSAQEESGLLGYRTRWGGRNFEVIQYWRSFEQLHAYARNRDAEHMPAWADFNRRIGRDGSVGIWHETYLVKDGQYETVYRNMPPYGLAAATEAIPATGRRKTAAGRLGQSEGEDAPVDEAGDTVTESKAAETLGENEGAG
jgi:hypothetical protein